MYVWGSLRTHYILSHACLLQTLLHATHTLLPTAHRLSTHLQLIMLTVAILSSSASTLQHNMPHYQCADAAPNHLSSRLQLQALGAHDDALHGHSLLITCTDYIVLHTLLVIAPHHLPGHRQLPAR